MTASKWRQIALGCCLLLGSSVARAQPSAAQKETARGLMAEGRELRDKGDLDGALARFGAADSIMSVPTTGFEVASTQAQLGRLVEARETLRRVLALPQNADDPEPFQEARSKARTLDQQLLARIGALHFVPSGVNGDALSITVDGEAVPKAALGLPFRVNPGHHVVVGHARDREVKREIDAVEAQTIAVELAFDADSPKAEPAVVDAPTRPPPPNSVDASTPKAAGLPMLAYVGGGVAVGGLLVGSVTGISAISHKNAAKKDCVGGSCPPSTWSDLDSAHSMATVSTVSFVVGLIGLGVGVGSLLLDEKPSPQQRALVVSPDVGTEGARLRIAGTF